MESTPSIRNMVKTLYKRLVYHLHIPDKFLELGEGVKLHDITEHGMIDPFDALYVGYYDKNPLHPTKKTLLCHIIADKKCFVALLDTEKKKYQILKQTKAWNYQQGAMTQWTGDNEIIFNDYSDGSLGCRILQMETGQNIFYPFPVQVVHPATREYLSINYRRLAALRPDYGYFIECENFSTKQSYDNDGIWKVDMETGKSVLIISLEKLIHMAPEKHTHARHKVNHLYYSPNGDKFVFLHRWINKQGKFSRLFCSDREGRNLKLLLDHRLVSHYSWINNNELIAWARTPEYGDAYIQLNARTGRYSPIGSEALSAHGDGHPTLDPNGKYIITDTYPDKSRIRMLILYDIKKSEIRILGKFFSPWKFENEKRCDLHPRWCNEHTISIDSAHEGKRKTYLIELDQG